MGAVRGLALPSLFALALSPSPARAGAAAEERPQVLVSDAVVEGVPWPAGSTLIYRRGFVRGCRSGDGFCLSEVKLSQDTTVCGVPSPKAADVYLDYVLPGGSAYDEQGVFLTVRGTGRFTLDGVTLRSLAVVRCDAPAGEVRLRGGQLDEARTFGRERLQPGVWFDLFSPSRGGGLRGVWFKSAATFRALALPKESMVELAPDGTVTRYHSYEYTDLSIQGVTCHVGFSTYASVYPSGRLRSCEVGAAQRIGPLTAQGETTFHESGAIETTTLGADVVLRGKALRAGQKIQLGRSGELVSVK